jgi:exodeoxyribonuclease VII large subunit
LQGAALGALDDQAQRLDNAAQRLGRPSHAVGQQRQQLQQLQYELQRETLSKTQLLTLYLQGLERNLALKTQDQLRQQHERAQRAERSLALLNPQRVLERGYAVLQAQDGQVIASARQVKAGQKIKATLADGDVALTAS